MIPVPARWRAFHALFFAVALVIVTPLAVWAQDGNDDAYVHVVAPGDTVTNVAARYGISPRLLMQANGLSDANYIYIGQRLIIPSADTPLTHTVQVGDTLSQVALTYGVSVQALMELNHLQDAGRIFIGQVLRLPGGTLPPNTGSDQSPAAPVTQYTVQEGDTLLQIAVRFGVSSEDLARVNNLSQPNLIRVGQMLVIPGGSPASPNPTPVQTPRSYTVQRGDSLSTIALRFGITLEDLLAANGLHRQSIIWAGQVLSIPPAPDPAVGKRIEVSIGQQRVYVYQNGQLLWNWPASTGRQSSPTVPGTYRISNKYPMAYASTWGLQMPYWMGIYWAGALENGFHGQVINANGVRIWEGYIGTPITFGCIMLSDEHMKTLYDWADVGTTVVVRY